MRHSIVLGIATVSLFASAPASAAVTTLYDQTNLPQQFVTPLTLSFTASSATTTLNFQGYQLPGTLALVNLFFAQTGTTPSSASNLLGTTYTYTPAPSSPFASPGSIGIYGARDLTFGGGTVGSYDTFSQTVATNIGSSYTLKLSFSNIGVGPNGLRITTGVQSAVAAVPEPATWALMLIGFGAIGASMRRQRRVSAIARIA